MARTAGSHAEKTGPRVREAALRLIAQHGYAAVSMRQIASEVGVQAGALYSYTPDKQALLFDLMQDHMEGLLAAWAKVPQGGTPEERLDRWVRFHISYHLERPDELFISYMELRSLNAQNFAALQLLRRRYEDGLDAILAAGQAEGLFAIPDTRLATMGLISMLNGVTVWYREGGRLSRERVEQVYGDMVRHAVGAPVIA